MKKPYKVLKQEYDEMKKSWLQEREKRWELENKIERLRNALQDINET